jgi:hypothetical protein
MRTIAYARGRQENDITATAVNSIFATHVQSERHDNRQIYLMVQCRYRA